MDVHFMVESQFGQVNESANARAENLTPSEARWDYFLNSVAVRILSHPDDFVFLAYRTISC
jgi:hypothetical protein